jgi:uncharacterized protein YhaN
MYHPEHGARLFQSEEELDAAGDGWVDSPADHAPRAAAQGVSQGADKLAAAEAHLTKWAEQLQAKEAELDARAERLNAQALEQDEMQTQLDAREADLAAREAALAPSDAGELDRDALKARATELGIDFPRNITTEKLAELVAAAG